MRDKFLFNLNESFSHFREDIFYRDGQRKPEDPPFTLAFVVSQALSYEAAQKTSKMLQHLTTEEQVHYTSASRDLPKLFARPAKPNMNLKPCWYCGNKQSHHRELCPAYGKTCSYCRKTGHFAKVCMQAVKGRKIKQQQVRLLNQDSPRPCWEESVRHEQCFDISNQKQPEQTSTTQHPKPVTLSRPQSGQPDDSIKVPFQIDSAASCNTLPAKYLVEIPWAHLEPSNAVLQPYAGSSIHPIGQIKLKSTRSSYVETLTFQVINTSQPALLSVDANLYRTPGSTAGQLNGNTNQARQDPCLSRSIADPQQGNTSAKIHNSHLGGELAQVTVHNVKCMTVIDVKEAFHNIPLTSRSSLMTTMSTPWGRYTWTRLPYGISSASEEWQRRIHMVLEGLTVISIADDILVPGCGDTDKEARVDHDQNLIAVLERLEQNHVKIDAAKMKFMKTSATFMGHLITSDGLRPDPTTVEAVTNLPTPHDKQGIRRFLGAINYLSKFCPRLSSVTQPLRALTKDNGPFVWSNH
ncbi:Retrovirus-related Pol poly from transposon [Paramuricea clavata]|uniref:Retrovirus-related Pol poly from transposon n=1 Tax=Paramuricea clavata TaxID=317549 RepID=A0A7D9I6C4_PARCT|nr:Retrovirus-related Pol poly from transposon [Paramuricea clavata]